MLILTMHGFFPIFTACRYASAVYAVVVGLCLYLFVCVCVSVTLRYCSKRRNV